MRIYGSAMPGGPIAMGHIPLPAPRPTGTDALTHYNQRPQRVVTPTATGTTGEIRAWAIANGFAVALRGSIPSRVRNAYEQEARRA